MHFGVLGPLRAIADDGSDVTPSSAQQRRVLAKLVLAAPHAVSVDVLEELVWKGPAPSANALQAIVSKLRKSIVPARIDSGVAGYSLIGEFGTDLADFERHVAAGEHERAERLVRGVPLADLPDDDLTTAAERARLAGLIGTARRRRLQAAATGASPADAVPELEAMVIAEPHDERWWALLMRAQHKAGMQAEALRTFQRARQTLADELGLEPGPELRQIERDVLTGTDAVVVEPALAARGLAMPARLSSFVGRQSDLAALRSAIAVHRLVTLVGAGGTGKTSTAVELVRQVAPSNATFISLSQLSDSDAIVRAVTRAVGLPDAESLPPGQPSVTGDPLDRVIAALGTSATVLVVDNCEHVIDEVAPIVHRLLVACAGLRVVATSRSSLAVPGEHVYPLAPLPLADAIALLRARAADHAASVAVDSVEPSALEALCERLDRLPLAIELAAARLRSMTIDELTSRLADRFGLLTTGPRTAEPRQQTLRAVVDWSYELLDEREQIVFRRLAVFVGGASADAVEFVAAGALDAVLPQREVLSIVDRLLDKSLIRAVRLPDGIRYFMLQTLHDYAAERLAESGEREAILVRHAQYYADLIAGALPGLVGPQQRHWLALIRRERDNLDAARATAVARQDAQLALELVTPLGWYFYMTGEMEQGAEAMADALGCPGPTEPALRAVALALHGWLISNGTYVEHAVASTSEAMALLDRVDDPLGRALIVNLHTMAMFFAGMMDRVREMIPLLEQIVEEPGHPWASAITKLVQGELLQFGDSVRTAERVLLEAADELERVGDHFGLALTLGEVAEIAEQLGQYDEAAAQLERAIEYSDRVGFSTTPLAMRGRLGNVETLRGNLDAAAAHHQALLDDPIASSTPWVLAMSLVGMAQVARRRSDFRAADQLLRRAWAMPRSKTVPMMRSIVQVGRGYLADQQGDHAAALEFQLAGLQAAMSLRTPRVVAFSLEGCAGALAIAPDSSGDELAARLLGAADALRRGAGGPMPAAERFDLDRTERRLRERMGDERFQLAFSRGASEDAFALVAELQRLR